MSIITCRQKNLPLTKMEAAERRALEINPENEAGRRTIERVVPGRRGPAGRRIAVVTARKWPSSGVDLSVSFLDNPSRELRKRILLHMNAWGERANVVFRETAGTGQVRIARFDAPDDMAGYWSYVGTEILDAEENEPTLNLDSFTMRTPDAEFRRVVRHEAGHTLGFDHEHMRSDIVKRIVRSKAIKFYREDQGWTAKETEEQVLTPLSKRSIMGTTESDPLSIMCYQLPGEIMKDGIAVPGGVDINEKDAAFAASLYPKRGPVRDVEPAAGEVIPPARDGALNWLGEADDTFQLIVMPESRTGTKKANEKPEFATVLATFAGARVTSTLRLRMGKDGSKTNFGKIIATHERIRKYTNHASGTLPSDSDLIAFGGLLFETLFDGAVRRLYDEARTRLGGRKLDLILTSMIPWIGEKPWEFAFDTGRNTFLSTEEIHFVRNVLTSVPADPIVEQRGPLRILVASAQPVGFGILSIEQEERVIRRGFQPLIDRGLVDVKVIARATPELLHRTLLLGDFQVVHFIGHGVFDDKKGEGCLVFENGRGGEIRLGERALRELFCKRGLSMVFLNSCESGRGGRADFNKGVAQSLVAHGLPALVANQYSVLDASATSFAQHFYWALAHGLTIGQSAREARIAVNYSLAGEPIDWAVPVLYARDPAMKLSTSLGTAARAEVRREAPKRDVVIAMWDVDNVFPGLEKTLEAMNRAQEVFQFTTARVSAPLDVWDLDKSGSHLWAERVAERLNNKVVQIGADLLFCMTRHWIRDGEWLGVTGWWADSQESQVILFSAAGFDNLPPEGALTDRAIVNSLVACVAGYYANMGTHSGGAKDCPMWTNEERDFQGLVGLQRFDVGCRRRLKPKLGKKLPALEALLKVF